MKSVLSRLRSLDAEYPLWWVFAVAAALTLPILVSRAVTGIESAHTNRVIAQRSAQAAQEITTADAATKAADEASVDRQVEDGVRARTIQPERERAAARVTLMRERSRIAETNYAKAQNDPAVVATDDAALFARNCASYAALYAGRRRTGCPRN